MGTENCTHGQRTKTQLLREGHFQECTQEEKKLFVNSVSFSVLAFIFIHFNNKDTPEHFEGLVQATLPLLQALADSQLN